MQLKNISIKHRFYRVRLLASLKGSAISQDTVNASWENNKRILEGRLTSVTEPWSSVNKASRGPETGREATLFGKMSRRTGGTMEIAAPTPRKVVTYCGVRVARVTKQRESKQGPTAEGEGVGRAYLCLACRS